MKINKTLFLGLTLIGATLSAPAQGTFQNLDFESASVSRFPARSENVPIASAVPGWIGYIGGVQQSTAIYDSVYLDFSGISILDSSVFGFSVIQGNYAAVLQAGLGFFPALFGDTAIVQSGLIPAGSQSLRFSARTLGSGSFTVSLGGQTLPLFILGSGGSYTFYGADIHVWAGQTAELAFTAHADVPHVINNYLSLDSM